MPSSSYSPRRKHMDSIMSVQTNTQVEINDDVESKLSKETPPDT